MYRALVSFSGVISMFQGEEREITNKETIKDLLKAEYIEEVKSTDAKTLKKENEGLKAEVDTLKEELETLRKENEELKSNVSNDDNTDEGTSNKEGSDDNTDENSNVE